MEKTSSNDSLSPEEKELWALISKKIRPLYPVKTPHLSLSHSSFAEKGGVQDLKKKTRIVFFEEGKKRHFLRKKQVFEIMPVLDLHGFTVQEAFFAFRIFMERAKSENWREIEIVTGLGTGGKGVIRREVRHWLERKEYSSKITEIFHPSHNLGALRVKFSVK